MESFCGCGESFKSKGNTCLEIKVSKVCGAGGVSMDQTHVGGSLQRDGGEAELQPGL